MTMKTIPLYVFDLDGTLCDIEHRLHYIICEEEKRNWDLFHEACEFDEPKDWVISLAKAMYAIGDVLILTARKETVKDKTVEWLKNHKVYYDHLVMRHETDFRKDCLIKKEMMETFLNEHPEYDFQFVVDDRQSVVDMWREEGYNCLQCNVWEEGAFIYEKDAEGIV